MGAFYLSRRQAAREQSGNLARQTLTRQGFTVIQDLSDPHLDVLYCAKIGTDSSTLFRLDEGNYCFSTGTLIYRARIGEAACEALFRDFRANQVDFDSLYGNFALVIRNQGRLYLHNDPQGVYNIWHNPELDTFTSSFPLMCELAPGLKVNGAAVYQQVFQEATFGGETVFEQIRRLRVGRGYQLNLQTQAVDAMLIDPLVKRPPSSGTTSMAAHLESIHAALSQQFHAIAQCFGDNIDSALSGGYDSRLLLALCREQGVTPHLHVYGKPQAADVQVAKRICQGEHLELSHEDKSAYPAITPADFPGIVRNNFYAFQGNCADGILDNGSDLATRRARTRGGRLLLNGGGGEVMRNFFYLPERRYRIRELLWAFYSRFDPSVTTSRFSEQAYYRHFESQTRELLGQPGDRVERRDVEYLYAGFRCTYWMGQNNAINNQFGWFLTPFVDASIAALAHDVPIAMKNHGVFQAALINRISPGLAAYPSDYGHDFSSPPPLQRRLKDLATIWRPPLLRKYLYRLRKRSRADWPYYLEAPFIREILPQGFRYMPEFFDLDKIDDAQQFKRICTLEYLFQHVGADL